ncbi:MAG TPA: hypothetical protein VMM78_02480 [Thermomicrobiales bacterium]|nr:hypothetical protein [Thermomicrobiales bacterium]
MERWKRGLVGTGLAFVVLFVAGFLLLGELFGGFADPDRFFVAHYANDANLARDLAGGVLLVAAGLALLLFLEQLTRHLRALGGSDVGLDAAHSSGIVAVTLLLAGAAALTTVTVALTFGLMTDDEPLTSPAVSLAPQLGYVLVMFPAMWALALAIAALVWSGWRVPGWPGWFRWLSVAAVVLLPLSAFAFMTIVLLPVWALGATVWAWRSPLGAPQHATR